MHLSPTRRSLLRAGIALAGAQALPGFGVWASEPERDVTLLMDFDELWRTLAERYCYFGEKQVDWNAVRNLYRPQAEAADSLESFSAVVGRVIDELYDAHCFLRGRRPDGRRGPYFDVWVEPDANGDACVTSVRQGSGAQDAGVAVGDSIVAVDGVPVADITAEVMPKCLVRPDPAAASYACNIAVSGRPAQPRTLSVRNASGAMRDVMIAVKQPVERPDIESRMLADNIGYIVIRGFSDDAVLEAFDAALLTMKDSRGLVIDVRENGGGDTAIARPIMGRFITETKPYARMRRREGAGLTEAWTEVVEPRGPFTYRAPVAVLTSRWSASMAEGFPMGMRGIGRATIIGTPMMRVGAAVFPLRLDRTGLDLQYSGEPVYDVNDKPRWELTPDIQIKPDQDALDVALAYLRSAPARRR